MSTLTHIAVHHSGGTATSGIASTIHSTPDQINDFHKGRFNLPSKYIAGQWGGYNFGYSPITRKFHQFRALGEETAAQKGWNFNTISICIFGNYSKLPGMQLSVDKMTEQTEKDIATFIHNLIHNHFVGTDKVVIAPNTKFDLSLDRVRPHRWYANGGTECYGTYLTDDWLRTILAKYKVVPLLPDPVERTKLVQKILKLKMLIKDLIERKTALKVAGMVSSLDKGGCPGHTGEL